MWFTADRGRELSQLSGEVPGVDPPTDAEVIGRSTHDPRAFGEIFDRHAPVLLGYVQRRVGPSDAEDVLADAFRIAFETRQRFDASRSSALPWLYGIAANLIMKRVRGRARLVRATERLWVVDDARNEVPFDELVTDHAENVALLEHVAHCVDDLPADDRETLLLYAWEHLSYDDIAVALGVPVGTVRSRLNRVRRRLRELRNGTGELLGVPSQRAPGGVS